MSNSHPVVLAHGIARFDILRQTLIDRFKIPADSMGDNFHYFKGIKRYLEDNGFETHHTNVEFAGSVVLRSRQLGDQIGRILSGRPKEKVHIIAHSMGGLDARHMIVDIKGMAGKVASLTTIGTPHLGTSLADFGLSFGGDLLISGLKSIIDLSGFKDLTTEACAGFNGRAEDFEAGNDVVYQTYASFEQRDRIFLPLQLSWKYIHSHEGDNDGLVPVTSQYWRSELTAKNGRKKQIAQCRFPVAADHLNQVGWWDFQEADLRMDLSKLKEQAEKYEDEIKGVYLEIAAKLHRMT